MKETTVIVTTSWTRLNEKTEDGKKKHQLLATQRSVMELLFWRGIANVSCAVPGCDHMHFQCGLTMQLTELTRDITGLLESRTKLLWCLTLADLLL